MDDTFLIFKERPHIQLFLDYLNGKHQNIKFTCEIEENSRLSFLDTHIIKENGRLTSSTYRKPTFTGLGLDFLSYSPFIYKINSIMTLINRAYNVCSSFILFDREIKFLENFFITNGFPNNIFNNCIKRFLNNKYAPKPIFHTASKEVKYIKLSYLGNFSYSIRNQFNNLLKQSFPHIDFKFVFTNNFTIGSLIKRTETKTFDLASGVVYLFTCSSCNARYIGSTMRWMQHRYRNHKGVSTRTGRPLTKPEFSAIRDHSLEYDHVFTYTDFKILASANYRSDLLISESLYISKMKPELNNTSTALQLFTQ